MTELVSPGDLDLTRWIRGGDTVIWGQACAEPLTLTEALFAQRRRIGRFRAFLGLHASGTVRAEFADVVDFISYSGAGVNRALHRAGSLEVLDAHYSSFPDLFRNGEVRIDVVLVQVPPAFADGTFSLGLAHEYLGAAVDAARLVIAEVNEQLPQIAGTRRLRPDEIHVVVPTSRPPATMVTTPPDETTRAIGANAAAVIEDGATLQVGIGALPDAVLLALRGHQDLGIHSGMIGNGFAELLRCGAVTNRHKQVDTGLSVGGVLMGDMDLFEMAASDERIQLRPTTYTHDPAVLSRVGRFTSVNAALEVDLAGNINTERLGDAYVGARGGAVDFASGASSSPGGVAVTALPSTAGPHSRIVPRLAGPPTVPADLAGVVVTEFGSADLRGRTASERAELLVRIAHPAHRASLLDALSTHDLQEVPR